MTIVLPATRPDFVGETVLVVFSGATPASSSSSSVSSTGTVMTLSVPLVTVVLGAKLPVLVRLYDCPSGMVLAYVMVERTTPAGSRRRTVSPLLLSAIFVSVRLNDLKPPPAMLVLAGIVYGVLPPAASSSCQPDRSTLLPPIFFNSINSLVVSEPTGSGKNSLMTTVSA